MLSLSNYYSVINIERNENISGAHETVQENFEKCLESGVTENIHIIILDKAPKTV